jgi:signal transduction histidine kinase
MNKGLWGLSLSRQFLLVSFPILLAATLALGWWIARQVESSVVRRIGGDTALYVDSFITPHLQKLVVADQLDAESRSTLDALMTDTALAKRIVSLRIWRLDGMVLFSSDGQGVGQTLPVDEGLAAAKVGNVYSELTLRTAVRQAEHGQPGARLIETYTPIHAAHIGRIIAAAEFYQAPDDVDREVGVAQRRSWLVVAGAMLVTYLLLFIVVQRGSRTIAAQQGELSAQVAQLIDLNEQNRQLHSRVSRAAEQVISLNEALLRRVSADVHDGPGQDLGFALMEIKNLRDSQAAGVGTQDGRLASDLDRVRAAVQSALTDLRAISADLEMPDIEPLDLAQIAARVVRDFLAKTGHAVTLVTAVAPDLEVPIRVKITLYRVLQESLANTLRHAQCRECRVELKADASTMAVEVSDKGTGFDAAGVRAKGRLGLSGMRQRVEVLGGVFAIRSEPGAGTVVRVNLPLVGEREANG